MKRIPQALGPDGQYKVTALVCETQAERKQGLQGYQLKPAEVMLFPFAVARQAIPMHMGTVSYPIDIAWTLQGKILKVVTMQPQQGPGDPVETSGGDLVVEAMAGWFKQRGLGPGSLLLPGMASKQAQMSGNILRSLTEAEMDDDGKKTAAASEAQVRPILSRLLGLLDRNAPWPLVAQVIRQADQRLSHGDRDRLARRIYDLGYGDAALRIIKQAQASGDLPITDKNLPLRGRSNGPGAHADAAIPMPGLATDGPLPGWEQQLGWDPTQPGLPQRPAGKLPRRRAGNEIHPGDRVVATEDTDGMSRDDGGTCLEIQNDAVKVQFDGEPVPRWITRDLLRQDRPKDDVLKELDDKDKEGGGPAGDGGPDEGSDGQEDAPGGDGGLAGLLQSLGGG